MSKFYVEKKRIYWTTAQTGEMNIAFSNNLDRQNVTLGAMLMECAACYLRIPAKSDVFTCRHYTVVALQAEKNNI
jgi:hypothetical protein